MVRKIPTEARWIVIWPFVAYYLSPFGNKCEIKLTPSYFDILKIDNSSLLGEICINTKCRAMVTFLGHQVLGSKSTIDWPAASILNPERKRDFGE